VETQNQTAQDDEIATGVRSRRRKKGSCRKERQKVSYGCGEENIIAVGVNLAVAIKPGA
jgi:hypothetical protein